MKKIGVLGGMGPEATILFQQRLLNAVRAQDDQDHIPLLIDMNPQVPSRLAYVLDQTFGARDPGPVLEDMAQRLDKWGAEALAMPCNTAHLFAEAIQRKTALPFFNMVKLSVQTALAKSRAGDVIGILASPALRKTQLFERYFQASERTVIWPEDDTKMVQAIRKIKTSGDTAEARSILLDASSELTRRGANLQLVACSEFSMIQTSHDPSAAMIDTLDVLAEAVARFALDARGPQRGV